MNLSEQFYRELSEPPDGDYPTLDDYAVALETLTRQRDNAVLAQTKHRVAIERMSGIGVVQHGVSSTSASDLYAECKSAWAKVEMSALSTSASTQPVVSRTHIYRTSHMYASS